MTPSTHQSQDHVLSGLDRLLESLKNSLLFLDLSLQPVLYLYRLSPPTASTPRPVVASRCSRGAARSSSRGWPRPRGFGGTVLGVPLAGFLRSGLGDLKNTAGEKKPACIRKGRQFRPVRPSERRKIDQKMNGFGGLPIFKYTN